MTELFCNLFESVCKLTKHKLDEQLKRLFWEFEVDWFIEESKQDLLEDPKMIDWITGGKYFTDISKNTRSKSLYKKEERDWGNRIKCEFFSESPKKNWSNNLGENVVKLMLERQGYKVWRPKPKGGYNPDWETDDYIWEVKTRTYTVDGSIFDKVLGCPFKYADVPLLYGKPLKIVVVAYQEREADQKFRIFDAPAGSRRKNMIDYWKKLDIEFIRGSDLLNSK